jgi:hypothetical protein
MASFISWQITANPFLNNIVEPLHWSAFELAEYLPHSTSASNSPGSRDYPHGKNEPHPKIQI